MHNLQMFLGFMVFVLFLGTALMVQEKIIAHDSFFAIALLALSVLIVALLCYMHIFFPDSQTKSVKNKKGKK